MTVGEIHGTIRARHKVLLADLGRARRQVERVQFDLRQLTAECAHPNAYKTTHMGENCVDCPDCGGCGV